MTDDAYYFIPAPYDALRERIGVLQRLQREDARYGITGAEYRRRAELIANLRADLARMEHAKP